MCGSLSVVAHQSGSPAEESKRVFVGDKLLQVQGKEIAAMSAQAIEDAICGTHHSHVTLVFSSAFDGELLAGTFRPILHTRGASREALGEARASPAQQ